MTLAELKGKLKKHRFLYYVANCPYPAPIWNRKLSRLLNGRSQSYCERSGGVEELGTWILEIGSGIKRRSERVINLDIELAPDVDLLGDGHFLPIRSSAIDVVIAEAVLEHVKNPQQVVAEIYRVLKSGGIVYAAIPFLQCYHASPHDYQRYTVSGIEELFSDFQRIESGACAGPTTTLHWIFREYVGLLFSFGNQLLGKLISLLIGWLTYPVIFLDRLLMANKHAHSLASAVYFIGKKRCPRS